MVKLPDPTPSRKEQIKFLLDFRYGPQGKFSKEDIEEIRVKVSRGQQTTLADIMNLPEEYSKSLAKVPADSLKQIYWKAIEEKRDREARLLQLEKDREADEDRRNRDTLRRNPALKADLDYWTKQPYWEVDDAVAVSLGLDPTRVNWRFAEQALGSSDLARQFRDRRLLAFRAGHVALLPLRPSPAIWLDWFISHDFSLPEVLSDMIRARVALYPQTNAPNKASADEITELNAKISDLEKELTTEKKDVSGKARASLLKIVLGLAIADLGYNPKSSKSPIPQEIADSLASVGINLDADTVRRWLTTASEEVEYHREPET